MSPESEVKKQVWRLYMLTHDVGLPVVRKYFDKFILCQPDYKKDFIVFLEHHKHDMYHLAFDLKCCKCSNLTPTANTVATKLNKRQFKVMYMFGNNNKNHIKRGKHGIIEHCSCGVSVDSSCSQKHLDLSTINVVIQAFSRNLENSHKMWLEKIICIRHKVCHICDFNQLSRNDTEVMWQDLEMAIIALATKIPIEDYEEGIQRQVDLVKKGDYSLETVQPIIDGFKTELETNLEKLGTSQKQILDSLTVTNGINQEIKEDVSKLSEAISEQAAYIKETKEDVKVTKYLLHQICSGNICHKKEEIDFHVKYSTDNSFGPVQDATVDSTKNLTEHKTDADNQTACLRWKVKPEGVTEEEEDKIKRFMRKSATSVECFLPYTITHIFDGCIVIETLLPKDIMVSKQQFENSIRKFLDAFVEGSGICTRRKMRIDVEILISKSLVTASTNYCCYSTDRPLTTDKEVSAVPQVSDAIVDATCETNVKAQQTDSTEISIQAISNYCCYETCKVVTKDEKAMLATPDMLEEMVDASIDTDNKAIQTDAIKTPVEAYFYKLEIGQNMLFAGKYVRHYAIYVGCTPNIESWFHRFISCLTKYVMESPTVRGNSSYCSFEKPKDDSLFLLPISGTTCNLLRILDDTMLKYSNTLILRFGNTEIPQRLQHFRSFDVPESILIPDELLRKITLWSQTYFIKIEIEPQKWIISKMSSTLSRRPIFIGCISDVEKSMNQFAYHLMSYFSGNGPSYHMNVPSGASFDEKEYMIIIPVTGSENDKYLMERLAVTTLKSSNVLILEFDDTEIPIDFRKFRSIQLSKEHFDYYPLVREVRRWLRKPKFRHERIPAESEQSTDSKNEQSIDGKRAQTYFIKIEIEPQKWIISKMSSTLSRRAIFIGCISDVEKSMNQLAHGLMSYFSGNGPSYHMNVPSGASFDETENMIIIPVTGSENDKYLMERLAVTTLKSSNVLILEFDDTEIPIYFRQFRSIQLSKEHFDYYRLVPEVRRWLKKSKFRHERIPSESEESTDSENEQSIDGKRALTSDAEKSDKQANTQTESHVKQN